MRVLSEQYGRDDYYYNIDDDDDDDIYSFKTSPSISLQHNRIKLRNQDRIVYVGSVQVQWNQNPRTLNLIFDTGSSDLWVRCNVLVPTSRECRLQQCPANSVSIVYASGEVCTSSNEADSISLMSSSNPAVTLYDATFGIGYAMDNNILHKNADGVLGLAFPSISELARHEKSSSFISHLSNFSMLLSNDQSSSEMMINSVNTALLRSKNLKPKTVPLVKKGHWTLALNKFAANETVFTSKSSLVVVDSGCTFLHFPAEVFETFENSFLFNCEWQPSVQYYICPKDTDLPALHFTLNSTVFKLNWWDYVQPFTHNSMIVEIQKSEGVVNNVWILGTTFLKVYYTLYDVENSAITFYCTSGQCDGSLSNSLEFPSEFSKPYLIALVLCTLMIVVLALLYKCWRNYKN